MRTCTLRLSRLISVHVCLLSLIYSESDLGLEQSMSCMICGDGFFFVDGLVHPYEISTSETRHDQKIPLRITICMSRSSRIH